MPSAALRRGGTVRRETPWQLVVLLLVVRISLGSIGVARHRNSHSNRPCLCKARRRCRGCATGPGPGDGTAGRRLRCSPRSLLQHLAGKGPA